MCSRLFSEFCISKLSCVVACVRLQLKSLFKLFTIPQTLSVKGARSLRVLPKETRRLHMGRRAVLTLRKTCGHVEMDCRYSYGACYQRRLLLNHKMDDCPQHPPEIIMYAEPDTENGRDDTLT